MIGNRALHIALVKKPKTAKNENTSESSSIDLDKVGQMAAIAQCTAETTVKVVIAAYVAKKLIDTASEIAVIAANAHFTK
jgi:hypothetical protein